jgi:hypothetical protein
MREASIAIRGNKTEENKRKCIGETPLLNLRVKWPETRRRKFKVLVRLFVSELKLR